MSKRRNLDREGLEVYLLYVLLAAGTGADARVQRAEEVVKEGEMVRVKRVIASRASRARLGGRRRRRRVQQ